MTSQDEVGKRKTDTRSDTVAKSLHEKVVAIQAGIASTCVQTRQGKARRKKFNKKL